MLQINEYFYHLQGEDLFVKKKHIHNEIEFIQVINGNGIILKNDCTYVLKNQHIYVIDARNTHLVYPQPENCHDYVRNKIVINADSFIDFYRNIGAAEMIDPLLNGAPVSTVENPEIDKIYKTIFDLCTSKKRENIAFAHGYITELIHWIYLNLETKSHNEAKDTFQKMLDVINEKDGLTSLGEISKILYMDKYYLCRLFKEKTGTTLSNYLADKILDKSCKLLASTSYSVEKISLLCGFSSSAAFARFFKNKCGLSPTNYRKEREAALKLYFS
ncbi:MAG: AraC family transcriptional regulator [Clostridia bacterium]|nr:AraC family transcriptional regulator [Clostridia bacterium]